MILDAVPFLQSLPLQDNPRNRILAAFIRFIEKKLGAAVVYDRRQFPLAREDLSDPLRLASSLKEAGVIRSFSQGFSLPDEPPMKTWIAICNNSNGHQVAGASLESDSNALYAALAEALERYIWLTQVDYFRKPLYATCEEIRRYGKSVVPEQFASFSREQRQQSPELSLDTRASYLWIHGDSLTDGGVVYLPAQTVSGVRTIRSHHGAQEPVVRRQQTIGLATWPTRAGAQLAGALEVVEREAYMITWLNQLTPPRVRLSEMANRSSTISNFLKTCRRYRIKPHAIRLITDAPTHVICVILEDESGKEPRFTLGLKAHGSLEFAIEKAATEALRARGGYRRFFASGNTWDPNTPVNATGHRERLYYWGHPKNAPGLEFLIRGKEEEPAKQPWETESVEQQLARLLDWCRGKEIECISVPLTKSSKNPTPFHIEMVVMPQLQPTYLTDDNRQLGGTRWKEVPRLFGYKPREKPFIEAPHPYS